MALDTANESKGKAREFDPATGATKPSSLSALFAATSDPHDPLIAAEQRRRERIFTLLNLGMHADTAKTVGHMSLTGKRAPEETEEARQRDEEDEWRFALRILKTELDAYIEELDAQLAEIDGHLREVDEREEAEAEAERRYANGTLDLADPANRALLLRAGVDPEDFEADPAAAFARARARNDAERDFWTRQREDVVRKRDAAETLRERADTAHSPQEVLDVAEDLARLRGGSSAELLDKATTDMHDRDKVNAIYRTDGFNDTEAKRTVAALADDHGFSGGFDDAKPDAKKPKLPGPT